MGVWVLVMSVFSVQSVFCWFPGRRGLQVELRLNIRKQFIAITRFHINTKTETFVKIEKK